MSQIIKYMDSIVSDAKEELTKSMETAETLAELWGAITYPTKKNGEPYAVLSKNFANCTIGLSRIAMFDFEKAVSVHGRTKSGYYVDDSLNCYETLGSYEKHPRAEAHPERVTKPSPYLVPFYVLSLDEIKEDIENRRAYWERTANDYKDALAKIEDAMVEVLSGIGKIVDKCEAENGKTVTSYIRQSLKNRYVFI